MESIKKYNQEESTRAEIRFFINEGLKDIQEDRLIDFDEAIVELKERYIVND